MKIKEGQTTKGKFDPRDLSPGDVIVIKIKEFEDLHRQQITLNKERLTFYMIDENSMKKPNTPNMGNRIIDFSERKLNTVAGIASVAILLFYALKYSRDDFLNSNDDESKRSLIEEVDYTGYRDTSTSVRTPSDYRRGGDNEESITKRIESAPNDRQTTTDESMKEIEEILTAEEVLYTVKEGDTRSSILMENV